MPVFRAIRSAFRSYVCQEILDEPPVQYLLGRHSYPLARSFSIFQPSVYTFPGGLCAWTLRLCFSIVLRYRDIQWWAFFAIFPALFRNLLNIPLSSGCRKTVCNRERHSADIMSTGGPSCPYAMSRQLDGIVVGACGVGIVA